MSKKNPQDPVSLENFVEIAPLTKAYEFKPGHVYLVLCNAKSFRTGAAYSLFKDLREMHPDLDIAVVATSTPEDVKVMEKTTQPEQQAALPTEPSER